MFDGDASIQLQKRRINRQISGNINERKAVERALGR
jgi:hypothetical protein